MTSEFSGELLFGGGGGRPSTAAISGGAYSSRQQQGVFSSTDLLLGKRSFTDFQSYPQHIHQQPFSILHQQQQQHPLSLLQQQYLMRSVRQRTNSLNFQASSFDPSLSVARFGVPVYQQLRQPPPPPISSLNNQLNLNSTNNLYTNNNNPLNPNSDNFPIAGYPGLGPDTKKDEIFNTLHELEKQLLYDNDDDDAVSVVTNSEWSETLLMGSSQDPDPNNNTIISPSPTSSTSSCCSSSASTASIPAKLLISEAATAISDGKVEAALEVFGRLNKIANPKGNSEQRLAFHMGNALRSRSCPNENQPPVVELYRKGHMSAMYSLYDLSPCFKFAFLAANGVLLEAITSAQQESLKVNLIDFDVGHGGQYINLLRSMAERGAQSLRVTVVETEMGNGEVVYCVKDGLMKLAEKLGINLKFEALTRKIHELTRESLSCDEDEAVVVNFAFKLYRVPDESVSMENLRDKLLRRVKGLSPRAVTLVEQDMNANTAPFRTRVNEVCGYYGALFDSLESTFSKDNSDRMRVEEAIGRKMANSVACEGRERVERVEVFGKWRARMSMAGFESLPLSENVAESMSRMLNSARGGNPGFTVKEESGGGVGFGWMGRTLTVASAWR